MTLPSPARFDVVTLGETMAQLIPIDGPLSTANSFKLGHAGAESNVAVGTARLGLSTAWASRLGDDAIADRILRALADERVDTTLVVRDVERQSGFFLKDPAGLRRAVTYYRRGSAASALNRSDVDRVLSESPLLLHLSGITPALSDTCDDSVEYALRTARDLGVKTSFDVNHRAVLWPDHNRAAERLAELASLSDIVFVGRDEAEQLWDTHTTEQIAERLGVRERLIVKDGAVAASTFDGTQTWRVPAPQVEVVESVGAGDAFAAGWLAAAQRGHSDIIRLRAGHLMARAALMSVDDHGVRIGWDELLRAAKEESDWVAQEPHTRGSR